MDQDVCRISCKYFRGGEDRYTKVSFLFGLDMGFLYKLTGGVIIMALGISKDVRGLAIDKTWRSVTALIHLEAQANQHS